MTTTNKYAELFISTTDTVTGIGAPVSKENEEAITSLKHRSSTKKLIIMVSSIEMAIKEFGKKGFGPEAEALAKQYWPGAVTLVCNDKLALRMPNNKGLLSLIDQLGPIYMTSANYSGQKPLEFQEAKKAFQEITKYYDFGTGSKKPSKIIDVQTGEVIRK